MDRAFVKRSDDAHAERMRINAIARRQMQRDRADEAVGDRLWLIVGLVVLMILAGIAGKSLGWLK